ncbi:MAG: universal stress protein [Desulfobacteraceae bacterium]|nr:MAG: universal stress protein [Desulfobacteraceae bacterium]
MEIRKILWPTDFSASAKNALDYVKSITERYGPEIHVLYVIEDIAHHKEWYGKFDPAHVEKLVEWENQKADERLEQICSRHLENCPLYIRHIRVGDPAQEILKLIDDEKIDMVVMSTKGTKGHFQFGSVADKVVKNATIPVLTIPVNNQSG